MPGAGVRAWGGRGSRGRAGAGGSNAKIAAAAGPGPRRGPRAAPAANGDGGPAGGGAGRRRPEYVPGAISDPNYVRIFDTTLRDGEQSPGATLTSKEKLDIARQLAKLGVDVIEAGFPIASRDDFEAVSRIAKEVGNEVVDGYSPVIQRPSCNPGSGCS